MLTVVDQFVFRGCEVMAGEPTLGAIPASARRWVKAMEVYWGSGIAVIYQAR